LVAKSIIFHVDADQVVQPRRRETENARDLFGVEKIRSLVPVDPHPSKVVSEKVVYGVSGEERQTVWDPVCLVWVVIVIGLSTLSQISNRLGSLLVGS